MAAPKVDWAQANPGAVLTTLYTCPTGRRANCVLFIAERQGAANAYRVAVSPNGASIADAHYLAYGSGINANETRSLSFKVQETDVVRVYANDAFVSFALNYYEDDVPAA
jgi:hypothetical protein